MILYHNKEEMIRMTMYIVYYTGMYIIKIMYLKYWEMMMMTIYRIVKTPITEAYFKKSILLKHIHHGIQEQIMR